MGMKPANSDVSHCDTLNLDESTTVSQVSIVNTHKVYNNSAQCVNKCFERLFCVRRRSFLLLFFREYGVIVGNPNRKKMHIFCFVGIFEYIC